MGLAPIRERGDHVADVVNLEEVEMRDGDPGSPIELIGFAAQLDEQAGRGSVERRPTSGPLERLDGVVDPTVGPFDRRLQAGIDGRAGSHPSERLPRTLESLLSERDPRHDRQGGVAQPWP